MENFKVQYVFQSKDDIGGDYCSVRLLIDDKFAVQYGDYYHDKGGEKIEGFINGYCHAKGIEWNGEHEHENIVDEDCN